MNVAGCTEIFCAGKNKISQQIWNTRRDYRLITSEPFTLPEPRTSFCTSGIHFCRSAILFESTGWVRKNVGVLLPPAFSLNAEKRFQKSPADSGLYPARAINFR